MTATVADVAFREMQVLPGRPQTMRLDLARFEALGETGLIPTRSELVEGEIILMPPVGNAHSVVTQRIYDTLRLAWRPPRFIRTQATQRFAGEWAPMPDLALLDEEPRQGASVDPLPRLVVEVSQGTLAYDLGDKRLRYARAGVAEYWVVDVRRRRVLVFRGPVTDATEAVEAWEEESIVDEGGSVSPLCAPEGVVAVGEVLPVVSA